MTSEQLQLAISDYLRTHSVKTLLNTANQEIQRHSDILKACTNEPCVKLAYTITWSEPQLSYARAER